MKNKILWVVVGCLVVLSLVLASCGEAATTTPPTTKPPTTTPPTTTPPTTTATGPKGDIVVAAYGLGSEWVDPERIIDGSNLLWGQCIFDGLIGRDLQAQLAPRLATAWQVSADGLTWDFTLRQGAKFWNGEEVKAADVAFTFSRLFVTELKHYPAAGLTGSIESLEVVDDYHVRFHMNKLDALFLANLTSWMGIVPKAYTEQIGNMNFASAPVGVGPWKFVSQVKGTNVKFEAFTGYYDTARIPTVKTITWNIVGEDATRLALLKTGGCDIAELMPAAYVADIKAIPGGKIVSAKATSSYGIHIMDIFSDAPSKLKDIRVRLALNYAVDRQAICDTLWAGYCVPGNSDQLCPNWLGYDPDVKPYAYDVVKAKALLAEAGAQGFAFDVTGFPPLKDLGEALVGYWEDVGLKPNLVMMDQLTWATNWTQHKLTGIGLSGSSCASMAELGQFALVHVSDGLWSYFKDPQLDAWYKEMNSTMDTTARDAIGRKIYKYLHDNAYGVDAVFTDTLIGVGPKIKSWDIRLGANRALDFETIRLAD